MSYQNPMRKLCLKWVSFEFTTVLFKNRQNFTFMFNKQKTKYFIDLKRNNLKHKKMFN